MKCQFCERDIADHFGIHFFKQGGRNHFSCCAYRYVPGFSEGVINHANQPIDGNESVVNEIKEVR